MPRKGSRNAAGGGTIRQRPDGRWEARYTVGRDPGTGKQIQKSVYGSTQREVRQRLQQITTAIDDGTYLAPSKMTVGEWLDIWHREFLGAVKPHTIAHYGSHIQTHLKPAIGAVKLSALQPHTIQALYNKLQDDGLSPKTIKNLHGVLHKSLKQAVMLGYLRTNPSDACVLPRAEKREASFIAEAKIAELLEAIKGHPYENVYRVDLFTGMRQGEILGLTWDCVDFENGVLTISKQLQKEHVKGGLYRFVSLKNDRVRRIQPAPFVMDILRQQRQKQLSDRLRAGSAWANDWNLVFTNELGGHLCSVTVYNHFKRIVKQIGIPDTRFHDMRHPYVKPKTKKFITFFEVFGQLHSCP